MNMPLLQKWCHKVAMAHGFDANNRARHPAISIALVQSELSECLEALREDNPIDNHCPDYHSVDIELADCVIRILDYCEANGICLESAIDAKLCFNETREYKHGKKF